MAKKITIAINGEAYPCSPTMGAMLRFKQETGKEVTEMDGGFTDLCVYLWCCIVSACHREGKKFDMDLMTFADSIDPEAMAEWTNAMQPDEAAGDPEDEKKSLPGSKNS